MTTSAPTVPPEILQFIDKIPMAAKLQLYKYANLKSDDITSTVLQDVAKVVKIPFQIPAPLFDRAAELIRADDPDTMADWLGTNDNIVRLVQMLWTPTQSKSVAQSKADAVVETPVVVCPECSSAFETTASELASGVVLCKICHTCFESN